MSKRDELRERLDGNTILQTILWEALAEAGITASTVQLLDAARILGGKLARDDAIEAMQNSFDAACNNMPMATCPKCNGRGFHDGFGECGHDPDWCELCGGPGEVVADGNHAMRAAIAALSK